MRLANGYGSVTKLTRKNCRKPYWARGNAEYVYNEIEKKVKEVRPSLGCYKSQDKALAILAEYYRDRFNIKDKTITYKELFVKWCNEKYLEVKESSQYSYNYAFQLTKELHDKVFNKIELVDLQNIIDNCDKNYPIIKTIKILYNELFRYAEMHKVIVYNPAPFVNIRRYKDKNPNKQVKTNFTESEVTAIWNSENSSCLLMLIYTGLRISELLNLEKGDVHLDENYFHIIDSKTSNGIRIVPIADKIKKFFEEWYFSSEADCPYLIFDKDGNKLTYDRFKRQHFYPVKNSIGSTLTLHCTRHTFVSMLFTKDVPLVTIQRIVGHSTGLTVTDSVYTHLDIQQLIDAVNLI